MEEFEIMTAARRRCLDGVTILLVEDSLSASEALRLMAVAGGARVRRADSLHAASRHLAIYRPSVVVVDLGLPDGDGVELIRRIARTAQPCPGLIAISGIDSAEWAAAARKAGAGAMLTKPVDTAEAFQEAVLSVLPDREARRGLKRGGTRGGLAARAEALSRDMATARGLLELALERSDSAKLRYGGQFVESLAQALRDRDLGQGARALRDGNLAPAERFARGADLLARLAARPETAGP